MRPARPARRSSMSGEWLPCAAWSSWLLLARRAAGMEMFFVPGDRAIDYVDLGFRLADAVPFARVADHDRLDARVLERDEILLGLRNRHVVVVLAVHEHHQPHHVGDVTERSS